MRDYTTDALLTKVRLLGAFPLNRSTFEPADAVQLMDMMLRSKLVPYIMEANSRHFLTYTDYTATESQTSYEIPQYAVNRNLVSVVYVSDSGEETPLTLIDHQEDIRERYSELTYPFRSAYVQGDYLIVPAPLEGRTLRLYYYRFPGHLVLAQDAARIVSSVPFPLGPTTAIVTVASRPTTWGSTTFNGTILDHIKGTPGFDTATSEMTVEGVTPTTVSLPNQDYTRFVAGDYLTITGTSPIPQVPAEAHELLAQMTVVKILEAIRDTQGLKNAQTELAQMLGSYSGILSPRVKKQPKLVLNRNKLSDWIL